MDGARARRAADAYVVEGRGVPPSWGPVAALDCGTNSTRLLVAKADGTVLERHMRITRLGEGVDATGRLSPAAISRTLDVLGDYRRVMEAHLVVRARLVATSTVPTHGMDAISLNPRRPSQA